jgi:hypothetical protein
MNIELSDDEALVLFDFLARFTETSRLEFAHVSEFLALSKESAALEKGLAQPLRPDYQLLLQRARKQVAAGLIWATTIPARK